MTDEIIKIKNAYLEIEIHGNDLILHTVGENGGTKKLWPGVETILEDLKEQFQTDYQIN